MAEMKKAVLKLELRSSKKKQKAMKMASGMKGVESVAIDMKEKKLTITGDIDIVVIAYQLRKVCPTDVLSLGPAKEPEKKKEEPKKEEPKKEEPKKEEAPKKDVVSNMVKAYQSYNPHLTQHYYVRSSVEDDPNACVIC